MSVMANSIRPLVLVAVFILMATQGCGTLFGNKDKPGAPSGVSAETANQKLTISWSEVDGAASYNLYYGTAGGASKENAVKVANITSPYTLVDLMNNTTYYLAVSAENGEGEGDLSLEVSAQPEARWERLSEAQEFCENSGILSGIAMSGAGDIYILCGYGGFEEHQHFDIRKWDGASFVQMGADFDRTDIQYPLWVNYGNVNLLVADDGTPWVAWSEDIFHVGEVWVSEYFKVAYWDGETWVQKGDDIDFVASGRTNVVVMKLAVNNGVPYLATEDIVTGEDEDIYVYYWDGTQWAILGDRLDIAYGSTPFIAFDGDTAYVSWLEYDITASSSTLLVKYWDGTQWKQLGDGIVPTDGWIPYYSLALSNGIPYLAWAGTDTHVSAWNATEGIWTIDAYPIVEGIYTITPLELEFIGATPYIIGEYPSDENLDIYLFARYYDGSSWQGVNSEIEENTVYGGGQAALSNGKTLCIFWINTEGDDNINNYGGCVP